MRNLLQETRNALRPRDRVKYVGTQDGQYRATWEEFVELAKDLDYQEGAPHERAINSELIVVLDTPPYRKEWLERSQHGVEEWERRSIVSNAPTNPLTKGVIL